MPRLTVAELEVLESLKLQAQQGLIRLTIITQALVDAERDRLVSENSDTYPK